jgi:hypothetical protein
MNTARAEKLINSLTAEERAYFIACTDVFHDAPYSVIGRPSLSNQLQNTVVINLERTISQADFPAIPFGSVWDVNIVSFPFLTQQKLRTTIDNGYRVVQANPSTAQKWGGVTAFGVASGGPTIIPASNFISSNATKFFYPEFTDTITDDIPRLFYEVLSMGMEVINSTPALTRGGNVVRYRVPTQGRKAELYIEDAAAGLTDLSPRSTYYCYPLPPTTEALATQYPDSVIDKAEQGSYQMHTLQDAVSDYYMAGNAKVHFANPQTPAPGGFNTWTSDTSFNSYPTEPPLIRGDFDMVGSYFTGLSATTTLKIRSRYVVSLVPSSSDAALTSLAKVSPDYNPKLDQLISMIQADFTPGIESSMNGSGDWWRVVLRGVAKIAQPLGKALGGEAGEAIGGGVAGIANLATGDFKKKKTQKPKVQVTAKSTPKRKKNNPTAKIEATQ